MIFLISLIAIASAISGHIVIAHNSETLALLQEDGVSSESAFQFRPLTEANRLILANDSSAALKQLNHAIRSMEPDVWQRFHTLLHLDELQQLLQSNTPNRARIREIERRFYGIAPGLSSAELIDFRNRLSHYVHWLSLYDHADLKSEFENRLRILDRALFHTTPPDTLLIARQVDWMIAAGQVPDLVAAIQRRFQNASIVVDVNPSYVMPYLAQYRKQVDESKFSTHNIVGVPVSGVSHFEATIWPELSENGERATFRLLVDGTVDSPSNESRPDPQRAPIIGNVAVTLKSSGKTIVNGYKDVYWNGSNLMSDPAQINCETDAKVDDVSISRNYRRPRSMLAQNVDKQIRKRAHNEVKKKSSLANHQSATLAERQISEHLDSEVKSLLDQANADIDEFYRSPLAGLGILPIGTSKSSRDAIRLGFRGAHYGGIGAPHPLPDRKLFGDVEVTLHESMCTSMWAGYLRGRKLDDVTFKNIHRELRGFVPRALRIAGNCAWSVKLDNEIPLELRFRDGYVSVTFHVASSNIDGSEYAIPFSVSARYQPELGINMPRFVREGNIKFELQNNRRSPHSDNELIVPEFMYSKFDAFFAREMHFDGLSAPSGNEWSAVSQMRIVASQLQDGWWHVIFKAHDLNRLN